MDIPPERLIAVSVLFQIVYRTEHHTSETKSEADFVLNTIIVLESARAARI